ncbi:MAG: VOC family protein [Mariniphaga sp.]|nr:VOC family protein [Mariniphaga sp.]
MKSNYGYFFGLFLIMVLFTNSTYCQEVKRSQMWGVAKMTFIVSDFAIARSYYGNFLGFDKAFSYNSDSKKVISFKVNDRQFLEFIEDKDVGENNRLKSISFETEDVEQMRKYLELKGIKVPSNISVDGAGNKILLVIDPSGISVEFIEFQTNSLHIKLKGKYLSENRISKRIHHLGLFTKDVAKNDFFYKEILGFKEMWRFDENDIAEPNYIYLQMPDCVENIEYIVTDDPTVSHPCLLVEDMQETIYILKEKQQYGKLASPMIGKGKRWLLNLVNNEGIRTEFTEAHTVR